MPRVAGQIDRAKNEAILDATSDVIFERGLGAPLDEIARRAGVSKQTIYNHYGSKVDLMRALIERRAQSVTAPLDVPGAEAVPEASLTAYAEVLLKMVRLDRGVAFFRLLIESARRDAGLVQGVLPRGFAESHAKLAAFLAHETRDGRLAVPDPDQAADFFVGMVIGQHQLHGLLGLPSELSDERVASLAGEAARRFMMAYAP
ncbi:MAG TPA: TetR/AcrR family transcriptional regulator [Caulobacteraceae bacterium]|jgi:AcrR family transcriptional regulator